MVILFDQFNLPEDIFKIVFATDQQEIVAKLQAKGLNIARRTAAKYRETLKILPTHLRRQRWFPWIKNPWRVNTTLRTLSEENKKLGDIRKKAGGRSRTDDLRFTKPLLYQLSYTSTDSLLKIIRRSVQSWPPLILFTRSGQPVAHLQIWARGLYQKTAKNVKT